MENIRKTVDEKMIIFEKTQEAEIEDNSNDQKRFLLIPGGCLDSKGNDIVDRSGNDDKR